MIDIALRNSLSEELQAAKAFQHEVELFGHYVALEGPRFTASELNQVLDAYNQTNLVVERITSCMLRSGFFDSDKIHQLQATMVEQFAVEIRQRHHQSIHELIQRARRS